LQEIVFEIPELIGTGKVVGKYLGLVAEYPGFVRDITGAETR